MRTALLLLVCTSSIAITPAVADDGFRYRARKDTTTQSDDKIDAPPDAPLPTFRKRTTLYMLVVDDDAAPHCDARMVDPLARTLGSLDYSSDGTHLRLGAGCEWMNVADVREGVSVDGAMWFRERDACTRAITTHRAVATELAGCVATPPIEGPTMRAAVDRIFTRGGALYTIVDDDAGAARCDRIDVTHEQMTHVRLARDGFGKPLRGVTTWQFSYEAGGTSVAITAPSTVWSDGSSMGSACAHDQPMILGPDWLDLGARYYLSAASCKAAMATQRKRASWFPDHASRDGAAASHDTAPGLGGC